jgi:hypothetical protein
MTFMIDIRDSREVIKYFYASKYWIHGLQNGFQRQYMMAYTLSFSDSRTAWQTFSH